MEPTRIAKVFRNAQEAQQPVLVAFLTVGDPTMEATPRLVRALERGGADLIELGVPFSDPIADGPVIMKAAERALAAGASLVKVIECARQIRQQSQIPLLLFSYLNPLLRYGFAKLAHDAAEAGIDGILITDVSVEEAGEFVPTLRKAGLDTVFLAAPTSTPERLQQVADYSSGFIYVVSRTGVTGERDQVSGQVGPLVDALRKVSKLPLAVGFGIAKAADAEVVARQAEGLVVGSAIVRLIEKYGQSDELETRLENFTRELKQGAIAGRTAALAGK